MNISSRLDQLHAAAKENEWLCYFAVFNRVALAAGFIPSGLVKIMGERFTSLPVNHPMGHYLEALHQTEYYYTFIGITQVTAATLLLIPRTVTLGAVIYFPIILNICILSLAMRFDGSLISSPLMVLANLYLLCWDYDKIKFVLPFKHPKTANTPSQQRKGSKFPTAFIAGVVAAITALILTLINIYDIMPRNTLNDCMRQFDGSNPTKAGCDFCACIHTQGEPLNKCLNEYRAASDDTISSK